jgi:hypothetical protein
MVTGDQVDVQVRYCLACCGTIIDSDVVTIGSALNFQPSLCLIQQDQQRIALYLLQVEE